MELFFWLAFKCRSNPSTAVPMQVGKILLILHKLPEKMYTFLEFGRGVMRAPNRENASGPKGHGALFFTTPTALGFLPRGIKIKRDTRGPKWSAIVRLEKNMHMVKSRAPWCKLHGALLFTGWVAKTRAPHPPPLKVTTGLCTRGPRRSRFYRPPPGKNMSAVAHGHGALLFTRCMFF